MLSNLSRKIFKYCLFSLAITLPFFVPKSASAQSCNYTYKKIEGCEVDASQTQCSPTYVGDPTEQVACNEVGCTVHFRNDRCIWRSIGTCEAIDPVTHKAEGKSFSPPYDASGKYECCKWREPDRLYSCGSGGGGGGPSCGNACCTECKKNCPASNQFGTCGVGSDGVQKYTCKVACGTEPVDPAACNGTSITCTAFPASHCSALTVASGGYSPGVKCGNEYDDNGDRFSAYPYCCGCFKSDPGAPSLAYPQNGQNVGYTSVYLYWDAPSSWGTGCPINTNQYKVYVGTVNPPTTVVVTVASSITSYNFTGVEGTPAYYWRIGATNGSRETLSDTWSFTGLSEPWWQVKDADILTNGNLTSGVPGSGGETFILDGLGGFPGVAIYGGTIADFSAGSGTGTVSSKGWLGNASTISQKNFNYKYFAGLIPGDVIFNEITSTSITGSTLNSGGTLSRGYYWYRFDGTTGAMINQDLTISGSTNLGSRKVILLVKGADLNISGNINITSLGQGFFMTIVGKNATAGKGNIIVDPGVTSLEGVYFADSQFKTGSKGVDADAQLYVRGAVAAYGGMVLERDLPNDNTTPAEFFEYGLDQMLLYPPSLSVRKIRWKEVAP